MNERLHYNCGQGKLAPNKRDNRERVTMNKEMQTVKGLISIVTFGTDDEGCAVSVQLDGVEIAGGDYDLWAGAIFLNGFEKKCFENFEEVLRYAAQIVCDLGAAA